MTSSSYYVDYVLPLLRSGAPESRRGASRRDASWHSAAVKGVHGVDSVHLHEADALFHLLGALNMLLAVAKNLLRATSASYSASSGEVCFQPL